MAEFRETLVNLCRAHIDLHPRAIAILLELHDKASAEDTAVSKILKKLGIPGPAGSRFGKILERDGYVVRHFYPGDNRSVLYRLTAKGSALCHRIEGGFPEELVQ